ncbi:hypothetical protein SDC9_135180 [bioreactor metagenome]|uniref:Uncharacterized protein n=1 Tax=bioreactor metagenome TaxID=1076179 RepID=A0A645DFN1_9ZZZZ
MVAVPGEKVETEAGNEPSPVLGNGPKACELGVDDLHAVVISHDVGGVQIGVDQALLVGQELVAHLADHALNFFVFDDGPAQGPGGLRHVPVVGYDGAVGKQKEIQGGVFRILKELFELLFFIAGQVQI